MRKRHVILLVIISLLLLLASTLELYRSNWGVDSSVGTATSNNLGNEHLVWEPVWVTPLKSQVADSTTNIVAERLTSTLNEIGLEAIVAPKEAPTTQARMPVAMFLTVTQWEVKRTLFGWAAKATAIADSIPLAELGDGMRIEINSTVSATGTYTGWLKRGTVERQLADKLVQTITEGIRKDLVKAGMTLASIQPAAEKNGLSFSLWRNKTVRKREQLVSGVSHPLLPPNSKVDYYWNLPSKAVIAYRVTATVQEIEQELLRELGDDIVPPGNFMDSINSRRRLFSPNISHWVIEGTSERQVLVIAPRSK